MIYFDQEEFGKRLRRLRIKKDISQEALAMDIGISTTHYRHIEHGDKRCTIDVLLMLAEIYQVSTDYLLTGNVYASEEEVTQLNAVIETLTGMVQRLQRSENK